MLAFLLAPILVVIGVSFNPTSAFRIPIGAVSMRWYARFFATPTFRDALFLVSLPVALAASALATVIGSLAAIGLVRARIAARGAFESVFMLPLLIPSILLGAAMYLVSVSLGFRTNFLTLVLGHMLLGIPYVIRVVGSALVAIDPRLEEAARSLGCTPVQAFLRVVVPNLRSSILSGATFAFIVSFSDINLALFVAGPETTTLPIQIYSQIFWEGDPTIAAASTVQIIIVGTLILLMQKIFKIRVGL
ncbi:ABC transporter permease [Methylobacterium sp. J-030]|uniref:ABC transporter permease n=1 Tax=Methylobacterium sp. J-030 TaxID=2836627 RepID=UPI001FBBAEF7|nr:ABC transporter permease [Methylobacterium sp. J-030]MCJ2073366.1 ABC transporter permease [Methylobacterium sp. J-030]